MAALLSRAGEVEEADGGHRGPGGANLIDQFDTNKDGKLTQAEIDAARQERLAEFDADKNGALSLEEYQALWLDAMRRADVPRVVFSSTCATYGNLAEMPLTEQTPQRPEHP